MAKSHKLYTNALPHLQQDTRRLLDQARFSIQRQMDQLDEVLKCDDLTARQRENIVVRREKVFFALDLIKMVGTIL